MYIVVLMSFNRNAGAYQVMHVSSAIARDNQISIAVVSVKLHLLW